MHLFAYVIIFIYVSMHTYLYIRVSIYLCGQIDIERDTQMTGIKKNRYRDTGRR